MNKTNLNSTQALCDGCNHSTPLKGLTKLTWRYNHKKKKYLKSNRSFIITGYKVLCASCLKKFTL